MKYGAADFEWWKYFIMPWMAGIVGWITNIIALKMTFYPTEFVGVELFRLKDQPWGLFGWQGIIPAKAAKIAGKAIDILTAKLLNVKEVFDRLDAAEFSRSLESGSILMIDDIINEIGNEYMPSVWNGLPKEVRDEVVALAFKECPEFLSHLMVDMQQNVYEILDLKHMAVTACVKNKGVLNQIFQEVGEKEFTFIERSGFFFGFIFGAFQSLVMYFYTQSWLYPVFGFAVGWFTNFVALKVIFKPTDPVKICGSTIHGIFLKRQKEVSSTYARVVCVEIVHTKAMWDAILNGPKKSNFYAMLRAHTIVFTEKLVQGIKPFALVALGDDQFGELKECVANKVIERIPTIIDESYIYATEAMALEETIKERMKKLSSEEFESVLHPAFEEDEILLIMVGGVLGMIVGIIQLYTF